jgi:general secretion pathway protein F/type IV pilus assembly protein PilC
VLLLGALMGGSWLLRRVLHTEPGRDWLDQQKIRLPGLGPIMRSLALSRFCRVLGTLLKNGVPLLRSLRIAKDATGNRILARSLQLAADNVSSGKSLVAPLRASGQFPRELLEMIAVGETANRLDTLLVEMADRLDTQTQRKIDALVKLIEPCLMLVMAAVVGFLVVALLMPVFAGNGL